MQIPRHPSHAFRARFGRGRAYAVAVSAEIPQAGFMQDLRMFALTFAGGFLFMTVYLA